MRKLLGRKFAEDVAESYVCGLIRRLGGGWNHVGYVYQATNWMYTGLTKPRTDKYSESGHSRHYAPDEKRRQVRTAKHRYIYLVGNKKEKKEMKEELRYKVLSDYPKGDSRHYDTANPIPMIDAHKVI